MAYALATDPMTTRVLVKECDTLTDARGVAAYWTAQHYIHAVAVDSWSKALDYYDEHGN